MSAGLGTHHDLASGRELALLRELSRHRGYPAVSLLAPLQRHRPGNPEDPVRLRHLASNARQRLESELGARNSTAVLARLDETLASLDLDHPPNAVAVFTTATETHTLKLPFPVPERLVIDDTFETRDLVRGFLRHPRYRLLALAEKPARLLERSGSELVEINAAGFPVLVEGARGEPLASGGYAPHSSRSDEQRRQFFRQVDQALGTYARSHPLPVVVAGTERDLAFFDEVTAHSEWIIGRLVGSHAHTTPEVLSRLAAPVVDEYLARRGAAAITELAETVGTGRALVGIKPVWDQALTGRGRVLLIEDSFEYPARIVDHHLEPAGDPEAPGVLDDAVDTLVETVLDHGGEVAFVESGALGEHGPLAMLLRY